MKKRNDIWETLKMIFREAPGRFVACILLLIVISFFEPAQLMAINGLASAMAASAPKLEDFVRPGLFFVVAMLLTHSKYFINLLGSYLWITAELALQKALIEKATKKPLVFFDISASYDSLERAQKGYGYAVGTAMMLISAVFITCFSFLWMLGYLMQINPAIAIAMFLIVGIKIVSYLWETKELQRLRVRQMPQIRRRGLLAEYLWSRESKVYGACGHFYRQWESCNRQLAGEEYRVRRTNLLRAFAVDALTFLCYGSVLALTVLASLSDGRTIVGQVIVLFVAMDALFNHINAIVLQLGNVVENISLSKDLMDFLFDREEPSNPKVIGGQAAITASGVSFRYPGSGKDALHSLDFSVSPGENIAVVGKNGSGKSTLVKLLCGLYEPTEGRISFGEQLKLSPRDCRNISTMFQEVRTYHLTLAENIWISDISSEAEDEPERILADVLGADWLENCPQGKDTLVGRTFGGIELSGGQKQRLSLGRAMYRRNTLIFLDEPTSAMDPLAEDQLYQDFLQFSEGKTTFFVTHRLASVRFADRILVLDGGRIAEQGTHSQLMGQNGLYAQMYNMQKQSFS